MSLQFRKPKHTTKEYQNAEDEHRQPNNSKQPKSKQRKQYPEPNKSSTKVKEPIALALKLS
jgi:hypothetical protein